ncbi:histone cell cycle regulator-like protein isoform X2 [Oratosquilla oratoria]|uniref:histone cell cycle regulator-like protein isoform X2 n=1 Tax=Oratosquilla oratoria TaxID=337810 RepID=UPI003F776B7C
MQLLKPAWVNHDGNKAIFSVDIHPDGSRFATGGQGQDSSGRVVIWNMAPIVSEKDENDDRIPKLLCQLDQHLGCVNSIRWSNSGRYLASAGDDKVVIIWQLSNYGGGAVFGSNVVNVESWRSIATLRGHNGDILDIAWSPGDVWLASGSIDNNIIIWNTAKWPEQVKVLHGHTGLVKGVTWDPVGRYLATQADDKTLVIWKTVDWTQEEKIAEPFAECGGTTSVLRPSWSPDGQYLVSAHAMNNGGPTAQIIDREGWNTDKDFVGHRKAITCVRFNPNILKRTDSKTGKPVQYCCVGIGSRDRSISVWFTSLKRPLVVVHDIFDDSVLDISWSGCGRYLMAVSKDGSLAFVHFTLEEIGKPLTQEETSNLHFKLYGQSAAMTNSNANPTIIENPEFLKFKEEKEKAKTITNNISVNEKKKVSPAAPINKQIEMRTADGKRRITPMFIPPPAEGETPNAYGNSNCSFSSSRQEKSSIVVEKVDAVVEPNISTPSKGASNHAISTSSQSAAIGGTKADQAVVPPDPPNIPSSLSARIESADKGEKVESVGVKRRLEDAQPISIKRKRGRPPLYDRSSTQITTPTQPVAPPPVPSTTQVPKAAVVPVQSVNILPEASISKSAKIQIPGEQGESPAPLLIVENDWKVNCKFGVPGNTIATNSSTNNVPAIHRIMRSHLNSASWVVHMTSPITYAVATSTIASVSCVDSSLHILDIKTGQHCIPPLQLKGKASQLFVQDNCVIVLTTTADLSVWDVMKQKKILSDSIRHLVQDKQGGVKTIQLAGDNRTPVVLLSSGEAYTRSQDLDAWLLLGDSASVRRALQPEYTLLPPCHPREDRERRPLASLLYQTGAYSGSTRVSKMNLSDDVRQSLTETYIERMLTSSMYLKSSQDYKFWLRRKVQFYICEGLEKKLRSLFDDLLGPAHTGSTEVKDSSHWNPKIMEFDKRGLLEEFLREILAADNCVQLQRLYTEYKDQLDANHIETI